MENNPSNRLCIIPNTELEGVLVNIIWLGLLSYRNNRLLLDMEHTEGGWKKVKRNQGFQS